MKKRYIYNSIVDDLKEKAVFLGGPRQVGKTTTSIEVGSNFNEYTYLDWDIDEDNAIIIAKEWSTIADIVIFDEIHKYPRCKNWIKGVIDKANALKSKQKYFVTGSARLDAFKKGGDSLLGRYHYWRLHPFTLDENIDGISVEEVCKRLLELGGFPEPFLRNDASFAKRWRQERFNRVVLDDIKDLHDIRNINLMKIFINELRLRAGQLIKLTNIANDLKVSPATTRNWFEIVKEMYIGFAVYPLTKNIPRSLSKQPKFYFFDNADCSKENGLRAENLIATTLLKRLHYLQDKFGFECELHYIRDNQGREVDFATVIDGKLYELIEVKTSDKKISTALKYYKEKLNPMHATQLVYSLTTSFESNGVLVTTPIDYFTNTAWNKAPWELDEFTL